MTDLESHHYITFNETINLGKKHQWIKALRHFNLYHISHHWEKPGLCEESVRSIVIWTTEKFNEQCLKSTQLNMPHSEMLL